MQWAVVRLPALIPTVGIGWCFAANAATYEGDLE